MDVTNWKYCDHTTFFSFIHSTGNSHGILQKKYENKGNAVKMNKLKKRI